MSETDATIPKSGQEAANVAEPTENVNNVVAPSDAGVTKANGENKDAKVSEESKAKETTGNGEPNKPEDAKSLYEFTVKDIDGNEVSLSKYKGHPVLIVNVASNCGFTKGNYSQLNELYDKFESQGLRIAAFPCNQFLNQESACDVDIKEFAKKKGVRFDMYSKIDVNGDNAIPLYKWLKSKQGGILGFNGIKWNFTKFLVDKEGVPVKRYSPTTSPSSIEPDIKNLLG